MINLKIMLSLKRTGGEGPWKTKCMADMLGVSPVICSQAGVASFYLFLKTSYVGHNPVCYKICYTASYMTFFRLSIMFYRKNPVHCNICCVTGYITIFGNITSYTT